jgi:hypothetical protein
VEAPSSKEERARRDGLARWCHFFFARSSASKALNAFAPGAYDSPISDFGFVDVVVEEPRARTIGEDPKTRRQSSPTATYVVDEVRDTAPNLTFSAVLALRRLEVQRVVAAVTLPDNPHNTF